MFPPNAILPQSLSKWPAHPFLVLTSLVQGRLLQKPTAIVNFDDVAIGCQFTTPAQLDIFFTRVLSETPLQALQDLLPSGELEFTTADRLDDVTFVGILRADAQQDLAYIDACGNADGLPVRVPHTRRKPIGAGTTQHFVRTQHVERMRAHADVERVLTDMLAQMLVDSNAARFESLGRDLLLLVTHQVGNERELIDRRFLGADIKNTNLRFRYTTTVPGLDVRLVLLVAVATSWTATHG